ncbi:MAG: hypothetical protein KDI55_19665 [Anaerolineae bacterium]|nr:hypothetical protein [Anaerolineae bacterium]
MSNHINVNGNGVLQRCMSLASGALSPDQRVNYEFGQVLGVDEFRQEQQYFLQKEYLHNRSLHGYGTVSGLRVSAARPDDDADEMLVTVDPGIGVDQFGRVFVLREEQCARLGAWYARQVQEGLAPVASPPAPLRAYVVARYDECLDALVAIPGQPCATADTTMVPSRIRDAVQIELRWQPPLMTAWDGVRALADVLAAVRFVPGLPPEMSDEDLVLAQVRALADPPLMEPCEEEVGLPPVSPPVGTLRLPAENARQVLDRILTVWVTEVRPIVRERVDLIEPDAASDGPGGPESAVLLACIDFEPAVDFVPADPRIETAEVNNGDRPYLLHTQLIQELLLLGGGETAEAGELREFATVQVLNSTTLRVWLHHPEALEPVGDPLAALALAVNDQPFVLDDVTPVAGFDNLFTVTGDASRMSPGDRLALSIRLGNWQESNSGRPLLDVLEAAEYSYLGRDGGALTVYGVVERILPSRDLATVATQMRGNRAAGVHLWFHTAQPVRLPATIPVRRGPDGLPSNYTTSTPDNSQFSYEWLLTGPGNTQLRDGELLLIDFDLETVQVRNNLTTLADLVAAQHLSLVGYNGRQTVRLFYEVELPPQVQQGPSIDEILDEVARRLPTQPFVTIEVHVNDNGVPEFELWFHVDRRWDSPEAVVFMEEPRFIVLSERPNANNEMKEPPELRDIPRDAFSLTPIQSNVYRVEVQDTGLWFDFGSRYLRFVFLVGETIVIENGQDMTLEDYINGSRIKFEGHNGEDAIVAFVRVPGRGGIG